MSEMNDAMYFVFGADTSDYDDGITHMADETASLADTVQQQASRIYDSLQIPKLDISVDPKSYTSIEQLVGAHEDIQHVIRLNAEAIQDLKRKYAEATDQINIYQNVPSEKERVKKLRAERDVIKETIPLARKAIEVAKESETQLLKEEAAIKRNIEQRKEQDTAQLNVKQRMRELMAEAAAMMEAAEREGRQLDQSKGRYREIIEELGRLKNIRGDIATAGSVFANDENKIAGVIQGLSGLTGAFSVAQGTVSLFNSENEDLQRIMLKVQSVMAITTGIQQIQQTLNKDSTFSLITLNKLKEVWNKLTKQSAEVMSKESEAISETAGELTEQSRSIKENTESVVAKEVVTNTDTASQKQNNIATAEGTVAKKEATEATNKQTSATIAGKEATKSMTTAAKGLRTTLTTLGIGAVIALLGFLVSKIMDVVEAIKQAKSKEQEIAEVEKDARKEVIKTRLEIEQSRNEIKNFTGTQEQAKKKTEELNRKYGESFGYYSSLSQWYDVLTKKAKIYIHILTLQAKAQAYMNKAIAASEKLVDLELTKPDDAETAMGFWDRTVMWFTQSESGGNFDAAKVIKETNRKNYEAKKRELEAEVERYNTSVQNLYLEAANLQKKYNIGGHSAPSVASGSGRSGKSGGSGKSGSGDTWNTKDAARREKEALDRYVEMINAYQKKANDEVAAANVEYQEEGLQKEIDQSKLNTAKKIQVWEDNLHALAEARKQYLHDVYMAGKGATEDGWDKTEAGKKSTEDYMQDILADPENKQLAEQYRSAIKKIIDQGEKEITEIEQKYADTLISKYGSIQERIAMLHRQFDKDIMNGIIPQEYYDEAKRQLDEAVSELRLEDLKKNLDWDNVFSDLSISATSALESLKKKLQEYSKINTLTPGVLKEIQSAISKIDEQLDERDPFGRMSRAFNDLHDSTNKVAEAQRRYNEVLFKGTDKEVITTSDNLKQARKEEAKAAKDAEKAHDRYIKTLETGNDIKINDAYQAYEETEKRKEEAKRKTTEAEEKYQAALDRTINTEIIAARNNLDEAYDKRREALENLIQAQDNYALSLVNVDTDKVTQAINALIAAENEYQRAMSGETEAKTSLDIVLQDGTQEGVRKAIDTLLKAKKDQEDAIKNLMSAQDAYDISIQGGDNEEIAQQNAILEQAQKASEKALDNLIAAQERYDEVLQNTSDTEIVTLANAYINASNDKAKAVAELAKEQKAYKDSLNGASQEEIDAAEGYKNAIKYKDEAISEANAALETYNQLVGKSTEEEIANAEATLNAAKSMKAKSFKEVAESVKEAATYTNQLLNIANEVVGCFEAMGIEVPEQITGFVSGMGDALSGISSIDLTKPLSLITGLTKAFSGLYKSFASLFNNDAAHEKRIQNLQKQIDKLDKAYEKLNNQIDKVYSKDASALIEEQTRLLEQKRLLVEQQLAEEKKKKKSDENTINELQNKLDEINQQIQDNKDAAIDAIFGEDLKSAIDNFADAYAEAWASGEDRAKSAKDTVKSMMRQMVTESIKAAIQSSKKMEEIRQKLSQFYADGVLTDWEQDYVYNMAEELQAELDKQFGWAENLLKDEDSREASQRGIATASQDSVDENNARLTTIQGHTYTLVQGLAELNATSSAILDKVAGIERNTEQTNDKLRDMGESINRIRYSVDDIQTRGLKLAT